ncbi:MAG TPA: hypothetical protein VF543_03415 [Pyrinomonadaceae bacterium]|jgi:hypothetical protein
MNRVNLQGEKRAGFISAALFILAWALMAQSVQAQWGTSGGNTTTTDNVGIGTTSPGAKLDIQTPSGQQDGLKLIKLADADNNWMVFRQGVLGYRLGILGSTQASGNQYKFGLFGSISSPSASSPGLLIQTWDYNTGNVGIGTSSPMSRFEIVNTSGGITASNYFQITGGTNSSSLPGISFKAGAYATEYPYIQLGNNGLALTMAGGRNSGSSMPNRVQLTLSTNVTGSGYGGFQVFNGSTTTDLMTVKDNGFVGIGTANPNALLHLYSTTASNDSPQIILENNNAADARYLSSIFFRGEYGGAGGPLNASKIVGGFEGGSYSDTVIGFETTQGSSSALVRAMTIKNGNVGIGTTSPGYRLDVLGQIKTSGGIVFPDGTVQTTAGSGSTGGGGSGTVTGVTAGAGLTGGGTSGTVTLSNSDPGSAQNIFKNIANAAGTPQFAAGSNNDFLRFEGTGGTTVSFDAAAKKIVINSSATSSTVSAANVSAGQFGQGTGGGNYSFPGDINAVGTITAGNIVAKYQDVAEWVPSRQKLSAGTVVILDPEKSNQVIASTDSYDTRVAGVISEQPGVLLGVGGEGKVKVATTGRVRVKVDATRGPIKIGDLLVASGEDGVAMKSEPVNIGGVLIHRPGTIIGKALEPLANGKGEILVLLSLQ